MRTHSLIRSGAIKPLALIVFGETSGSLLVVPSLLRFSGVINTPAARIPLGSPCCILPLGNLTKLPRTWLHSCPSLMPAGISLTLAKFSHLQAQCEIHESVMQMGLEERTWWDCSLISSFLSSTCISKHLPTLTGIGTLLSFLWSLAFSVSFPLFLASLLLLWVCMMWCVMCDVNEREKQQGLLGPPGAALRSLHYKNRTPFISHYASDLTRLLHQRAATDTRGAQRAFSLPLLRAALLHAQRRI